MKKLSLVVIGLFILIYIVPLGMRPVTLPDEVDFEAAAFTTLGAIALHGFRLAAVRLRAAQLVLERTLPATIQAEIRPAQGADVGPLLRRLMEPMATPTSAPSSSGRSASTATRST